MKLVERSVIRATPAKIWPFIITPEHFREWNEKIVSMEARGVFVLGQPFTTCYKLTGRSSQCLSIAVEIDPLRVLEFTHTAAVSGEGRSSLEAVERITLEPGEGFTVVTKTVVVRNHGVPWFLLPVIWFVTRFGRRQGEDKLKTMCER